MIRVTIEVLKKGDPDDKEQIGLMIISNDCAVPAESAIANYNVEYITDGTATHETVVFSHMKRDGATALVAKAFSIICRVMDPHHG